MASRWVEQIDGRSPDEEHPFPRPETSTTCLWEGDAWKSWEASGFSREVYVPLKGSCLEFSNLRDWLWLKVKDVLLLKLKKLDDFVWCLWLCNDTINLLNSNPKEVVCTHTHTRSPFLQLQMRTNLIFKWYQLSQCFLLVSVGWWHRIPCLVAQILMATKWWLNSKGILPKCP